MKQRRVLNKSHIPQQTGLNKSHTSIQQQRVDESQKLQ